MPEDVSEANLGQRLSAHDIDLLLDEIYRQTGYDFRQYSDYSIRNRLVRIMRAERMSEVRELEERIRADRQAAVKLVSNLTIRVTEMFRDPRFFQFLRVHVVPALHKQAFIRVWIAGCATGEEAFSLAILLHEAGLYERCRIYATDIHEASLQQAKDGRIPTSRMTLYAHNYRLSGGRRDVLSYFSRQGDDVFLKPYLLSRVLFSRHNLAIDRSFNEFHLILCRNVLIYFNAELQNRVHELIYDSLADEGYLALGDRESIRFTKHAGHYYSLDKQEKVFRIGKSHAH